MRLQTRIRLAIALLFAAFLAMPRAAHAVGETTGRLIGRVTEAQTGASVPGATITVSNPGLGAPIQTTTSEDGSFDVANLPYGAYDVEISYAGVKPIRRRVAINANQATPLNVAWSAELAQAETTVVVEERHPTRPDTAMTGSTWDIGRENKLPI